MVSLVLVGHSPALLRALRAMIAQSAPRVAVAIAGGTATGRLGTSGPAIVEALRAGLAAAEGDGVAVLFDIGSAVLALEIALEDLDAGERALVGVSGGPLVEGALRAAVEAAGGAPLAAVVAAADAERFTAKLPPDWGGAAR